jgi:hypothetical protein
MPVAVFAIILNCLYFVQENNQEPMVKKTRLMTQSIESSNDTS